MHPTTPCLNDVRIGCSDAAAWVLPKVRGVMENQEHYLQLGNRVATFWLVRVSAMVIMLHVFLTAPQFFSDTEFVRYPEAQYAVWVVLLGLALGALWQLRPQCERSTMIQTLVWLVLACLVCQPVVLFDSEYYTQWADPFPALMRVSTVSFFVVRGLLSARSSAAYAVIWCVATMINMSILHEWQYAALLCLQSVLVHLSCTFFVVLMRRCVLRTYVAIQQAADVSAADTQRAAKTRAYLRWDGLVHDKVIGALTLAGRSAGKQVPDAAQQLAGDALASLAGRTPESTTFERSVRDTAHRLGLTLHFQTQDMAAPQHVMEAMTIAVGEALTNVAKHADVEQVWVTAEFTVQHAKVTVTDHGRGFGQSTPSDRRGLALSIAAPLAGVGGVSSVRSAPGQGTTVTLKWSAQDASSLDATWPTTIFAPVVLVSTCSGLLAFGMGAPNWISVLPALHIGIALALAGANLAVMFDCRHPWRCHLYAAAVLILMVVCAVIAPADTGAGWRHWYVALSNPLAFALPLLWLRWTGTAWVVAQLVALGCTKLALGEPVMGFMTDSGIMSVACLLVGLSMRVGLDRATVCLAEGQRKKSLFEAREAERQELQRISDERRETVLELTGETLHKLASGGALAHDERNNCLQLESRARNLLIHGVGLPDTVSEAIDRARRDGALVTLVADTGVHWAGFDTVAATILPLVGPADVVTISGPREEDNHWSMVCHGPSLTHVTQHFEQLRTHYPSLEIYDDEDSCMAVLPATT